MLAAVSVLLLHNGRRVAVSDGHANVLDLVVVKPAPEVQRVLGLVVDDRPVGQHQCERAVRLQKLADLRGVIFESCKVRFSVRHRPI